MMLLFLQPTDPTKFLSHFSLISLNLRRQPTTTIVIYEEEEKEID
jgi:hypothetical protein